MDFDLFLFAPRLDEMPARARQAEEGGFAGLFVAETTGDPFQRLAVASLHTRRALLGASVALAFPRSPMLTAVSAWDLQRVSDGRFVLGLGSQVRRHVERRFSAPFAPPVPRLREYVRAVRHIWGAFQGEHPLAFHGEYYTVDYLPQAINPGPLDCGPPPIQLAAIGPRMFRAAGEVADGVFVHPVHTAEYLRTVAEPALARGLAESGRSRDQIVLSATVLCVVAAEGEIQREAVRRQLAFYASTPAYRPVLEVHGWGELGERLQQLMRHGEVDAMAAAVPDHVLDAFCVVADSWGEAIELARDRYRGVVDRVMFQNAPPLDATVPAA